MKDMVGGCCVCSDERGWAENPLVYCDGQGCTVAVHQACYGIVTVPSGNWYCRKCESQERAAKVKCELCPCKEGAFKKTDTGGWAHVVCALYIPEVRFGNVTSMEPIIQTLIPPDRFNKSCYICESQGREAKAKIGACMNCNKAGCKNHFHVTCAQAEGLLCEEAGTYLDNVKYCGYCQHHYSKLKKGSNVKAVPAFKPSTGPSDSIAEKSNSGAAGSGWSLENPVASIKDKKKKNGRKSQVSPKSTSSSVIVESPGASDDSKAKLGKSELTPFANVLAGVGLVPGPKALANDLVDSEKSEPNVFLKQEPGRNSETAKHSGSKKSDKLTDSSKHQSTSGAMSPSFAPVVDVPPTKKASAKSRTVRRKSSARSATPTSSIGGHDTESTLSNISDPGFMAAPDGVCSDPSSKSSSSFRFEPAAESSTANPMSHSVIVTSASALHPETTNTHSSLAVTNASNQRTVSPLVISSAFSNSSSVAAAGNSSNSQPQPDQASLDYSNMEISSGKNSKGSSAPAKKPRRGRTPKAVVAPESPPSSPDSAVVSFPDRPSKKRKKAKSSAMTAISKMALHGEGVSNEPSHSMAVKNQDSYLAHNTNLQTPSLTNDNPMKRIPVVNTQMTDRFLASLQQAPQDVPVENHLNSSALKEINDSKESLSVAKQQQQQQRKRPYSRNGINAPHMLGNQINPASSVAQKMSETLTAELEAHNVVTLSSPIGNFTGVPFPSRSISPSKMSTAPPVSSSSNPENLEELLERQWEQGSQFLMEQAQHYDIASLLSCLHSLRQENMRLEDHVASLNRRRDHLLAVNARLSVPLTLQPNPMAYTGNSGAFVDKSIPGNHQRVNQAVLLKKERPGSSTGHITSPQERNNRGTPYMPQMENGMAMSEHLSAYMNAQFSSPQASHKSPVGTGHPNDRANQSPVIVSSRNPIYHPAHSGGAATNVVGGSAHLPPTMSPVQGSTTYMMERNLSVLRSPSSTPEMARSTTTLSQQQYAYQIVSPPISGASHMANPPHPMASSFSSAAMANQHALNPRRDLGDLSRHSRVNSSPIERR